MSLFGKKTDEQSDSDHPKSKPRVKGTYGIEETIQLMRRLPVEQNPELVVLVLKNTLQSMSVNLKDIIRDAVTKEKTLGEEIADLKATIAKLEEDITQCRQQVSEKEGDLAEVIRVKDRLDTAVAQDEVTIPLMASPIADDPKAPPVTT